METGGFVYFIRSGSVGRIKIGYTADIHRRLMSMQTDSANKLNVLGVITGVPVKHTERELHRRFAHLRREGEWFEPAPELLAYIESETTPLEAWQAQAVRNCVDAIAGGGPDFAAIDALR